MENPLENIQKSLLYLSLTAIGLLGYADTALAQSNTLVVTPASIAFSTAQGQPQPAFVSVSSSSGSVPFTVSVTSDRGWLGASIANGTATSSQQVFQVFVSNANLPTGNYTGSVTLTPTTGNPVVISVTLAVGRIPVVREPAMER